MPIILTLRALRAPGGGDSLRASGKSELRPRAHNNDNDNHNNDNNNNNNDNDSDNHTNKQ